MKKMKLEDITADSKIFPGEYLFYKPASAVVVCGAVMGNKIKALHNGRLIEAPKSEFKKIQLTQREYKESRVSRCKGCKQ